MLRKFFTNVAAALALTGPGLMAQQWSAALAPEPERERTFQEYKQAFEDHYKQHPVPLDKEQVKPTFRFTGEREVAERMAIEEYKLFKRWEWLMEPRTYPEGKLDMQAIERIRETIPEEDKQLLQRTAEQNPLKLKLAKGQLLFPLPKLWKSLGPNDAIGGTNLGRVNSIQFDPANSKTIYIGTPDGGVWRSADAGSTWAPLFDSQPTLSVGDVAIDPANSKYLYAATSDPFGYGTPFWGGTYSVGVRKSTDAGATWVNTGLTWTVNLNRTIRRLVIHPTNGKILLAATSDGVYRTADAGATWTKVVPGSAFDAEFQPNDGNIAYVTTSTVLKSTDAGATFAATSATCGGARYNIEIARSNPKTLYTLCTNGTVQKSIDSGATWSTTAAPGVTLYGYYDNVLSVSPVNDKVVYVAGFNMKKTIDGGTTWSAVPVAGHVDNHCIRFFPGTDKTILVGNDGGLFRSTDSGATWASLNKGLVITQFYGLGISKTTPTIMVAGAQDNGNMKFNAGTWTNITNADGMRGFIDWSNANTVYVSIQNGGLYRSLNGGASFTGISTPSAGNWVTPWQQDPSSVKTIYAATNKVYRSLDQGTTWTDISGALPSIGLFVSLKVAPSNSKVIYAGGGNKLYRTTAGGPPWTDITAGLPVASNYLTDVTVSDTDPNLAWVTFSGYTASQKVYFTKDGGATWNNLSGTLANMPVNTIVHENKANNPLYIGTDAGVYYRNDGLSDWVPYKAGLPNVIVDRLDIHYATKVIRAATYGRGAWEAPLN
jgi:photosystem II stability/assembly factor-like uncharacterized protein